MLLWGNKVVAYHDKVLKDLNIELAKRLTDMDDLLNKRIGELGYNSFAILEGEDELSRLDREIAELNKTLKSLQSVGV